MLHCITTTVVMLKCFKNANAQRDPSNDSNCEGTIGHFVTLETHAALPVSCSSLSSSGKTHMVR